MADLDQLAGDLSPKKRALLELLLKERARSAAAPPPAAAAGAIPRRPDGPAPLSFTQERLWFLDQLEPGNAAYNVPAAVRLLGHLDVAALARSLAAVVARHEVLRTRLVAVDGRPRQEILPGLAIALPLVDLAALSEERRRSLTDILAGEQTRRPFDLAAGPLLRITLLRLAPAEHAALLTIHHAASDTWSMGILVGELAAEYEACLAGRSDPLPPLPVQFADFAAWQRAELAGPTAAAELGFWKGALADLPEGLELPLDHPRPPVPRYRGAGCVLAVPADLAEALRALSRRERASLFMTLLAAWSALLSRLTHADDIVVGTPLANRNRPELERLIGPLLNTVLLRANVAGDPPFAELLRRVRAMAIDAFAHRDLPFERLVEELRPERSLAKNPLFSVDFILQNAPRTDLAARGLSFLPMRVEAGTAQLDLSLSLTEQPDGLEGWLEYDRDLFEEATADRLADALLGLLAGAAADPEARVSALPLLSAARSRELLAAGAPAPEVGADLVSTLAARAGHAPDAVAVATPGDGGEATASLTYGELAGRAGRLARFLRGAGVGPEVPVGLFLGRSAELIVALWGVLEAGGAFLALDLTAPAERLAGILADAAAPLVLTTASHRAALAEPAFADLRCRIVGLDDLPTEEAGAGGHAEPAEPAAAGYLLYTSGSTGTPKGVVVQRRALAAYTAKAAASFALTAEDRVLQTAALSFDTSLEEIFPTLAAGATLVLRTAAMLDSPAGFWAACRQWGITVLDLPTAFWHLLVAGLAAGEDEIPHAVRLVIIGGERALPARVAAWLAAVDPAALRLLNTYGPTETTIVALTAELNAGDSSLLPGREVPIGRPLPGVTAHVLDRFGGLLPFGVAGELALGGEGVARGYLLRPELTARRFVPDPFGAGPGGRLYRTGDLVRHRPDGALEFLGRVDQQVKVRGFRVEPGEVEAVLAAQPEIAEAVVAAFSPRPGETRLAAWFVPRPGSTVAVAELRARLARRLPDYLVPAAFVELAALPRSTAGKLLRRALPDPLTVLDPGEVGGLGDAAYVAPSGPIEEVLAAAWAELLSVPRVSAAANVFELGAHSLLLTQVVSRIRQLFRVELPVKAVFEAPTVAGLARRIETARREASGVELPPIVPAPRDRPLPLSFTQERMWFLQQLFPGISAYNVPGAVHLRGPLDVAALIQSLSEIVRRHEIFRTTFESAGGEPVQVIAPPRPVALPRVDLTALPADRRPEEGVALVEREARRPFDLVRGPMLRLHLALLAPEHHLLSVVTHHVTYDMWAREVFIWELATLYQAFAAGAPSPLPELPLQFADFAAWQRGWMRGEVLERQLGFWREALAGMPEALELPTDRPRPPVQTYGGARRYFDLPPALGRALRDLGQSRGTTLFMVLLAAFQTLLGRYSAQERTVVGMPIASRNRLEIEKLIGFFANALAIPADLSGDPAFLDLLGQVRETALEAYAHQDLPFEYLVQELQPQRDLSRQPIFQVMFNFLQDYAAPKLEVDQVSLEFEEVHNAGAPYDLFVSLWATGDGLRGSIDYNVDLFDAVTLDRMAGHYGELLAALAAAPASRLSDLPSLTSAERAALLWEWNDSALAPGLGDSFWQLFAAQAARTPQAVAVSDAGTVLRYGELCAFAERLAAGLAAAGVGPGAVVPLLMERSPRLVAAILALFRLGAAYLPLAPRHPPRHHLTVLAESHAPMLLVERELAPLVAEVLALRPLAAPLQLLVLEALAADEWELPPLPAATGAELAYVIFTSGSTGVPKGAAVESRGMINHLQAKIVELGLAAADAVAQTASQTFDISVWQMLAALAVGARVHVFDDRTVQDPEKLLAALAAERITIFEPVPALLRALTEVLAEEEGGVDLSALRWVIPTGEALPPDLARDWLVRHPATPLLNAYGPTECSDDVTHQRLATPEAAELVRVPIGRPVVNLRLVVLDATANLAPIGVPGELLVGGVGVGRGYLHAPRRTAEVFVPDPFATVPGERLYRTGDLARRLADGRLDFLGRIDHQVKVRGFRIELGEIEAVLRDLPDLSEVVVVARADDAAAAGEARLVAYYVRAAGAAPTAAEPSAASLREALALRLPEYMVPAAFVELAALPLSANGKVDRKALPAPEGSHFTAESAYLPPAGPTQEGMAAVWRDLLGVTRIGAGDNFFHLGGHSLMATRLVSRVRERFGVELPLSAIFEAPTLAGLSEVLDVAQWGRESAALAVAPGDPGDDFEVGEL